jgi:hypothetical protein
MSCAGERGCPFPPGPSGLCRKHKQMQTSPIVFSGRPCYSEPHLTEDHNEYEKRRRKQQKLAVQSGKVGIYSTATI